MRIPYKKWALTVLLLIVAGVGAVVLTNCVVDAYGILRSDFSRQFQEPNQRFVKIKYLLGHKEKYDSFLFGSSRVLQIDTKKIRNGRYYNLGYSEGLPQEHLENIKLLLRSGVAVKNLLIGLDDFSYRVNPETHRNDLLRQQHYLVSGKGKVDFYSGYFMKISRFIPALRDYVKQNCTAQGRLDAKKIFYDFYDSGRIICTTCDAEIEADVDKHIHDPKFAKPFHYDGDNLRDTLASLRELVRLAKDNHIRLTLFINPIHETTYLDTDQALFFAFKKGLAEITDYYDFSGLNTITTNNYYYYETSHFRPMVGDMMLNKMFEYPPVRVPPDFGVLVTRQNVDHHLEKQRARIRAVLGGAVHTAAPTRTAGEYAALRCADPPPKRPGIRFCPQRKAPPAEQSAISPRTR